MVDIWSKISCLTHSHHNPSHAIPWFVLTQIIISKINYIRNIFRSNNNHKLFYNILECALIKVKSPRPMLILDHGVQFTKIYSYKLPFCSFSLFFKRCVIHSLVPQLYLIKILSKLGFWYQKKAYIFLITAVKFERCFS